MIELTGLLVVVSLFSYLSSSQNVSMKAWVEEGYYYSHRCEITIEIISNYFESKYQLFHILAQQNANFFTTIEYSNVFYAKGTNEMQAIMTSSETYCKFPMSTTYYCPFLSVSGYDPYGLTYYEPVNSTFNKLTIRLGRPICSEEGKVMSFRIQMPVHSDYSQFYMYVPNILNTTQITVDKLSFVYDQEVIVDVSSLSYKQVKGMSAIPENIFLVGCQFGYPITVRFDNVSYFNSWDEIDIFISNLSSVQLSTNCSSNLTTSYSCTKTSYGYNLINSNQSNMIKSYEIADQEYYEYGSYFFNIQFGLQFSAVGQVDIEVVVKANNNSYQESWLNMTHNSSEIYGRKIFSIQGENQQDFLLNTSGRYDPIKCIVPIYINNSPTSSNNSSSYSTNGTNNTSNSTNNYQFDTTTTSLSISHLVFIIAIIFVLSLTIFFTVTIKAFEKMFFLITIFILSVGKILYLALKVDESWLTVSDPSLADSLVSSSTHTYSLELFILKYTFLFQFLLNTLYFLNYLILILCSQEIHQRIKKFYGTKTYIKETLDHIENKTKINQCNLSSVIFTVISALSFLTSFKIYALLIMKLQLDVHSTDSDFKKCRFKNSVLYKIHAGHLGIDLLLESNVLIWLFMTIQNCSNQIFTYVLYVFLVFYCIHAYLMAVVLKVFILMTRKTDQMNKNEREKIKNTSINLENELEFDENPDQNKEIEEEEDKIVNENVLKSEYKVSEFKTDQIPKSIVINSSKFQKSLHYNK